MKRQIKKRLKKSMVVFVFAACLFFTSFVNDNGSDDRLCVTAVSNGSGKCWVK